MKSKEEIERLAKEEIERYRQSSSSIDKQKEIQRFNGFVQGYTQCQKDIFNELNEWIVITLSAESKLGSPNSVIETLLSVKYKIESLNKQD